jgi:hypothetical protein
MFCKIQHCSVIIALSMAGGIHQGGSDQISEGTDRQGEAREEIQIHAVVLDLGF